MLQPAVVYELVKVVLRARNYFFRKLYRLRGQGPMPTPDTEKHYGNQRTCEVV